MTGNNNTRPVSLVTAIEFGVVTLIWGSTWLVIKGQLGTVPVAWSVAYRFLIAGALLTVFCRITGRAQRHSWGLHGFAAVAGAAQFMLNFNLVYAAETRLTSGLVSLVFALLVVPNTIFARIFLKAPVTRRFVIGSGIGLAGLALVFSRDLALPAGHEATLVGLALAGAAVLSASIANVMQASARARAFAPLPLLALIMTYGAVIDVGYALITVGAPVFDPRPTYWLGLAYLAVVASVIAFSLYYGLLRRIGPGNAAYTSVVIPVVAMTLSTIFEAYRWTPLAAVGALLALAGLVVALRRDRGGWHVLEASAQSGAEIGIG